MSNGDHDRVAACAGAAAGQWEQAVVLSQLLEFAAAGQSFECVLITPPWPNVSAGAQEVAQTLEQLPIGALVAAEAQVLLWTPIPLLALSLKVLTGWGLRFDMVVVCETMDPPPQPRSFLLLARSNRAQQVEQTIAVIIPCIARSELLDERVLRAQLEHATRGHRLHIGARTSDPNWVIIPAPR